NQKSWDIKPMITFRGLVTLISSCPNLRKLGLVFDATTVDLPTAEKPGGGVCNTNITTFDVGCSPIEHPLPVAVALSAILPCVGQFNTELVELVEDKEERQTKWDEVSKFISVLASVRG
ncbi:hypothetical protein DFH29DRAFT_806899, partial [Suillus ampliporus]